MTPLWKRLIILIAVLGLAALFVYLYTADESADLARTQKVYESREGCYNQTGKSCHYETCDNVPLGKTQEEVCGKYFKAGWVPDFTIEDLFTGREYGVVRADLADNKILPVPNPKTVSLEFPEIGECSQGLNSICQADFKTTDGKTLRLYMKSEVTERKTIWTVVDTLMEDDGSL